MYHRKYPLSCYHRSQPSHCCTLHKPTKPPSEPGWTTKSPATAPSRTKLREVGSRRVEPGSGQPETPGTQTPGAEAAGEPVVVSAENAGDGRHAGVGEPGVGREVGEWKHGRSRRLRPGSLGLFYMDELLLVMSVPVIFAVHNLSSLQAPRPKIFQVQISPDDIELVDSVYLRGDPRRGHQGAEVQVAEDPEQQLRGQPAQPAHRQAKLPPSRVQQRCPNLVLKTPCQQANVGQIPTSWILPATNIINMYNPRQT